MGTIPSSIEASIKMNDTDEELSWLEEQAKLHDDNPALKDAFEQIAVIRGLVGINIVERKELKNAEAWEKNYWRIIDEAVADGDNPTVQDAWAQYYMLKKLLSK